MAAVRLISTYLELGLEPLLGDPSLRYGPSVLGGGPLTIDCKSKWDGLRRRTSGASLRERKKKANPRKVHGGSSSDVQGWSWSWSWSQRNTISGRFGRCVAELK